MLKFLAIVVSASTATVLCGSVFAQASVKMDFPEQEPVNLGDGWDIEQVSKKYKSCINFDGATRNYNDTKLNYQRAIDNESLNNALDISASASLKSLTGNFSATAKFARETNFNSSSTYMSVLAEVLLSPEYVVAKGGSTAVSLTDEMLVIAKTSPDEFFRQCGTGFVSVIQRGARLTGLVEFKGTTQEEKEQISATASINGLSGGLDISANSVMRKYQATDRFSINAIRAGGNGNTISLTLEDLNKEIASLPQQATTGPKPFGMIVQPYEALSDWPGPPITVNISDYAILARAYGRLYTVWGYAIESTQTGKGGWFLKYDADRENVSRLIEEIQNDLSDIRSRAQVCLEQSQCDIGKWRSWNDLSYRSRLPLRGAFVDLGIDSAGDNLEKLPENLADARIEQWIKEVITIRCRKLGECIPPSEITNLRNTMVKKIRTITKL